VVLTGWLLNVGQPSLRGQTGGGDCARYSPVMGTVIAAPGAVKRNAFGRKLAEKREEQG
jgi:hypothetical protein